jgi:hypothetical protein
MINVCKGLNPASDLLNSTVTLLMFQIRKILLQKPELANFTKVAGIGRFFWRI